MLPPRILGMSLGLLMIAALGCGKHPDTKSESTAHGPGVGRLLPAVGRTLAETELNQIGLAYIQCVQAGMPPSGVGDLEQHYEGKQLSQAMQKGVYVIYWNVDTEHMPGNTILGYQKDPDKSGKRAVLLCNGGVEAMTEQQFKAARHARK